MKRFHIVLVAPEIPQNTGTIGRLCVSTETALHLVKPLGFSLEDKFLRRAGLDYWKHLAPSIYENWEEFLERNPRANLFFLSTKGERCFWDVSYRPGDYLVFGKETKGLPEDLLAANYQNTIRIPMRAEARSLNLSNSVAIAVYEALRQNGFGTLCAEGHLTSREE